MFYVIIKKYKYTHLLQQNGIVNYKWKNQTLKKLSSMIDEGGLGEGECSNNVQKSQ